VPSKKEEARMERKTPAKYSLPCASPTYRRPTHQALQHFITPTTDHSPSYPSPLYRELKQYPPWPQGEYFRFLPVPLSLRRQVVVVVATPSPSLAHHRPQK